MIFRIVLIAILSIFSPVIGLIVAVPYFTKNLLNDKPDFADKSSKVLIVKKSLKLISIFTAVQLLLVVVKILNWQYALEIWVSVGLSSITFAYLLSILTPRQNYEWAILGGSAPGIVYIVCKNIFFFDYIKQQWEQNSQLIIENLEKMVSPEKIETIMPIISKIYNLLLNGNAAIWMFGIVIGLFIGALIFSKKSEWKKWRFDSANFPNFLQIGIVVGLILFIFKQRIISYNTLATCGFFYLIQGYSILYFLVKKIFQRNKSLGILMLILPLFSYITLAIISILGLLDNWINFRRIDIIDADT